MAIDSAPTASAPLERLARYPLVDALIGRRSRRFGKGMRLDGGPLAYASAGPPQPLTLAEEAALAFAANGVTGPTLADLPHATRDLPDAGNGNILTHLAGRTAPSGDGIHTTTLFVTNDEGTWLLRRPQDYPRDQVAGLAQAAREGRFVDLYERSRVRIADNRTDVPRDARFVPPFNRWSANVAGTTYFVPVADLTALFINIMLAAFDEGSDYFIVDERNRYAPAGLGRFARSRGGPLADDPRAGRLATLGFVEGWLYEFAAIEQGGMLQNLGLMAEALGLGGFAHFAAHPFAWPRALGFRMEEPRFSKTIGAGPLTTGLLRALGRNLLMPTAVGLEHRGEALLKPYCPPAYPSMRDAVLAFVDYKFGPGRGTLNDGGAHTAWRDGAAVQAGIAPPSDRAIAATIACCEYIHRRYGRFPAGSGPFRTVLAYQAHHLDTAFYERFYRAGALGDTRALHARPDLNGR